MNARPRIFSMPFARVYPLYVAKAGRRGRTPAEVEAVIGWLTGYDAEALAAEVAAGTDLESFFRRAPAPNPARF
ncbi:MAG: DUF2200 family protein, partial [Verrucomicrobiota bacterium]